MVARESDGGMAVATAASKKVKAKRVPKVLKVSGPVVELAKNDYVIVSRAWFDRLMEDMTILSKVAPQRGEPTKTLAEMERQLKEAGLL